MVLAERLARQLGRRQRRRHQSDSNNPLARCRRSKLAPVESRPGRTRL